MLRKTLVALTWMTAVAAPAQAWAAPAASGSGTTTVQDPFRPADSPVTVATPAGPVTVNTAGGPVTVVSSNSASPAPAPAPAPAPVTTYSPGSFGTGSWSVTTTTNSVATNTVTTTTVTAVPYTVPSPLPPPNPNPPAAAQSQSQPNQPMTWSNSNPMFAQHPYDPYVGNEDNGYVKRIPIGDPQQNYRFVSGTASGELGYVGKHAWRGGLSARLNLWRFGIDTDLSMFGKQKTQGITYAGSSNVTFSLIMRPRIIWRLGGGVAYLANGGVLGINQPHNGAEVGGNLTSSVDVFPFKPLVLSGQVDYGRVGHGSDQAINMIHTRATLGLMLPHGVEVYGGYDFRRIGQLNLQGPTVGVRVWF